MYMVKGEISTSISI